MLEFQSQSFSMSVVASSSSLFSLVYGSDAGPVKDVGHLAHPLVGHPPGNTSEEANDKKMSPKQVF